MDDAELRSLHAANLRAFVLRARRAAAHSLALDRDGLRSLASGTTKLLLDPASRIVRIRQEYPPEETIESAAARVRPLLLEKEATFHGKAFAALRYFSRSAEVPQDLREGLESLRTAWRAIKPNGKDSRGYSIEYGHVSSPDTFRASDNVLAFAFIYGDVVHHDEERLAETAGFGVVERYRAAAPLVAHLLLLAIGTLNVAQALHRRELLPPEITDAFTATVIAAETVYENEASVYMAEVIAGEKPPSLPGLHEEISGTWVNALDHFLPRRDSNPEH